MLTSAKDGIEALPTPVRAALVPAKVAEAKPRNLLAENGLNLSQRVIYELLSVDQLRPIDDIAESRGLNSSEVLATLLDLERKGMVRRLPGKQFSRVLL